MSRSTSEDNHNNSVPIEPPEGNIVPEADAKAPQTTGPINHGDEPQVATAENAAMATDKCSNDHQSNSPIPPDTKCSEPEHTQDMATQNEPSQPTHHKPKRQAPHNSGFVLHHRIGKGSFATVYRGEWGGDLFPQDVANDDQRDNSEYPKKQTVAIKVVHQSRLRRDRRLMDIFEGEMAILKQMKHPHVVHLIDVIQTSTDYNLIMEYCSMGELSRFIRGRKKLIRDNADAALLFERYPAKPNGGIHNTVVRHILSQLASALAFLREQHLVHRDLKPQNLLLKPPVASQREAQDKGYIGRYDLPVVKVADFGFARFLPATSMAETMCGSPLYMAPEILNRERYNALADLWSVGAVTYEMIMGKPPFPASNPMELMKMIDENKSNVVLPPDAPKDLAYFVRRLLVRSPNERMSFEEFFAITTVWAADPELEFDVESKGDSSETVTDDEPASSESATGDESTAATTRVSYIEYLRQHGASDVAVHSPSPSPEASMSHSHLIPRTASQLTSSEVTHDQQQQQQQGKQPVSGDSDNYVFIEKRTIEVNSLADDMQTPNSAQRRLTNPDKQPRRRRLSSIAYGASPTNALAQALLKSSVRLFGTSKDNSSSSRLSRDPSMESISQRLKGENSPDIQTSLSAMLAPMNGGEKRVIDELEQLATIGKVVSLYADIKFTQLDIDSVDGLGEEGRRLSESRSLGNHHNFFINGPSSKQSNTAYPIQSPSQIDPYLQLKLASEALALHLKSLSILSRAMDCVSVWWEQEHRNNNNQNNKECQTTNNPGINSLVQWVRDKFNECMDKAEIEKIIVAKLKKETSSAPPEINAERLLFDRGLEMAKTAAHQEASAVEVLHSGTRRDLIGTSEMNYGTAVWMLKALTVTDKDGEELSEDDRSMVERMMAKVADRLSAVRSKHVKSPRTSSSIAISSHSSNHSASSHNDMRLTPP